MTSIKKGRKMVFGFDAPKMNFFLKYASFKSICNDRNKSNVAISREYGG